MLLTQIKCGSAPPLLRNDLLQSFNCLTLDCETYLAGKGSPSPGGGHKNY